MESTPTPYGARLSAAAVVIMVVAASATIGFGVAPSGSEQPNRALALGATPTQPEPSPTEEPTLAERFASQRITATATSEPTVPPPPTATETTAARTGVSAAALISTSGQSYSASTVKAWARQAGWPESTLDAVVAVAWCESRHTPGATNGIAYGLMQVVPLWFSYAGIPFSAWTDPVSNLRVAWAAYNYDLNRGYAPWTQWQCKPYMVAPAPLEDDGNDFEEGIAPLPTPENTVPPTEPPTNTPTTEPTATPAPTEPLAPTNTPAPTEAPTEAPATPEPSSEADEQ